MWLTPCRFKYWSIRGVVGPCWVPTCIFTGSPERLRFCSTCATPPARVASPRSRAATAPISETNDLRFIPMAPCWCDVVVGPESSQVPEDRPAILDDGRRPALRVGQAELGRDAECLVDRG